MVFAVNTPRERLVSGAEASPDRALLGGKGANLALLARAGLPVPAWFALTTGVFEEVAGRLRGEIEGALVGVDPRVQAAAEAASGKIARAFLGARLAPGDRALLLERFDALFGEETVAVRSSGCAEDSGEHSFAGQMDTFLHVTREGLEERVLACFASAWSPRALLYRALHAASEPMALAVVVQRMVESRAAGVLFTADPVSGDETRAVVSAGLGLGEGVVSDRVETDTWTVDAAGAIVARSIARKKGRVVRGGEGTVLEAVDVAAPALSDDEVGALVALGRKIAAREGVPQDVEWAVDSGGKIHLLQARPITTRGRQTASGRLSVFDSSNIVESYPGITLPLTFSFARAAYEQTFRESSRTFGVPEDVLLANHQVHAHLIALIEGRVYYDLLNMYRLFQLVPGFEGVLPAWEKALGLEPGMVPREAPPTLRTRLLKGRIVLRVVGHFLGLEANVERFLAEFRSVHEGFRSRDLATLDAHELLLLYEDLARRLLGPYSISVVNDFFAQQLHALVGKLIARYGLDPGLGNDLFCGEKGMESVEPVRSALAIAARIRGESRWLAALEGPDAWRALREDPALRAALDEHVRRFGDRVLEELKLETPPLDEDPRFLVATLRNLVASGEDVSRMEERERAIRDSAETRVRAALRWHPLRRAFVGFVLARARRSVRFRENLRLARSRAFGMVKRIFVAIGRDFARRGLLDAPRDVFYLTVDEVAGAVRGSSVTRGLGELVAQRKREYEGHVGRKPAARIVVRGPVLAAPLEERKPAAKGDLRGVGCSPGVVRGRAKVVRAPDPGLSVRGEVLVAPMTDPGWVFLMVAAKALVVERGSILSHTAIIGRELGIPTVVGVAGATELVEDGRQIEVDGTSGRVQLL
jgi:pyruvate,water dikinase